MQESKQGTGRAGSVSLRPSYPLGAALLAAGLLAGVLSETVVPGVSQTTTHSSSSAPEAAIAGPSSSRAAAPVSFEPNRGQVDRRVDFLARGTSHALFLTGKDAVFAVGTPGSAAETASVRMRLLGARPNALQEGRAQKRSPAVSNYLKGNDPNKWLTGIPHFAEVVYRDVYPGTALLFHGRRGPLEYDFKLAPGADPRTIRLGFRGSRPRLAANGDLVLPTSAGEIRHAAPIAYQRTGGRRVPVDGSYALLGRNRVGFRIGSYDKRRPLVIDPVLTYSSYLGGGAGDYPEGMSVDSSGSIYLTGSTFSPDFPITSEAHDRGCGTDGRCEEMQAGDVFVSKMTPDGSGLVYSTFLGGSEYDAGISLAVDGAGAAYLTGITSSPDFPTTEQGFDRECGTDGRCDPSTEPAGGPVQCAYPLLPGDSEEPPDPNDLVANPPDPRDFVNDPPDIFPNLRDIPHDLSRCLPGDQERIGSGTSDTFVVKLDAAGSSLGYSTYLGGSGWEFGGDVAVDPLCTSSCAAYVTGSTSSECAAPDLPSCWPTTAGARQRTYGGGSDAFVAAVDTAVGQAPGTSLLASSYLGGAGGDSGEGIAVPGSCGSSCAPYLTGTTSSECSTPNSPGCWPTGGGAFQSVSQGADDGFVTRLTANMDSVIYSTYLGGADYDRSHALALDPSCTSSCKVFVAGSTNSRCEAPGAGGCFPTMNPYQATPPNPDSVSEAFVTQFGPGGNLEYSTYLGGSNSDQAHAVAVDPAGSVVVTGQTYSEDFPPPDSGNQPMGGTDAFVTSLVPAQGLSYTTLLGGTDYDDGSGIAVGPSGDVHVVGRTYSDDFPWVNAYQERSGGNGDAFISTISPNAPDWPMISRVDPIGGPLSGGTKVSISGTGLAATQSVEIGGEPATQLTVHSDESISVETPPGEEGRALIKVTTPSGTSPRSSLASFYYGEGSWSDTGATGFARQQHTATLLANGKVLVAGGVGEDESYWEATNSAELYDPVTGEWTPTNRMATARVGHTAILITGSGCAPDCGKVLVVGGAGYPGACYPSEGPYATAELYDPKSGTWSSAGNMGLPRSDHDATLLPNGTVLVTGGRALISQEVPPLVPGEGGGSFQSCEATPTAEIYHPGEGWEPTTPMASPRYDHTASLVSSKCPGDPSPTCYKVLAVGGREGSQETEFLYALGPLVADERHSGAPELYDVLTRAWSPAGNEHIRRFQHSATVLPDGRALIVGGVSEKAFFADFATSSAEIYDPSTNTWSLKPRLEVPRRAHAAALLPNGKTLVVGGGGRTVTQAFDPASDRWVITGVTGRARFFGGTATLLSSDASRLEGDTGVCGPNCGRVLVVGASIDPTTELYTPPPQITDVTPLEAPLTGGVPVTIRGVGFTNGTSNVSFGGTGLRCPSESCSIDSYRQITVLSPAASAERSVQVSVTNEGGTAFAPHRFSYAGLPGEITDLTAEPVSSSEVRLSFSAPGQVGKTAPPASKYEVKQSREPITDEASFAAARSLCSGSCALGPKEVGERLTVSVRGLQPGVRYYYAVRAQSDEGLNGPISNLAEVATPGIAGGRITDLTAKGLSSAAIKLTFSAPAMEGSPTVPPERYVLRQSKSPITSEADFEAARSFCPDACKLSPRNVGEKVTITIKDLAPRTTYYYAVRPKDDAGNPGEISNVAKARTLRAGKKVRRKVSLKLRRGVAVGRVKARSASKCRRRVPVVIRRGKKVVARDRTNKRGRYRAKIPIQKGRYRAVAKPVEKAGFDCKAARSVRKKVRSFGSKASLLR